MIEARKISKQFGEVKAVDNISFSIKEGETLVLVGTSGCGKTTTLRMVNRLIEADKGEVRFDGKNITTFKTHELRRKIGYVIQKTGLFPHYTVWENIAVVPALLNWEKHKTRKRTEELLHKLHLDPAEYGDKYPRQLSGGQQQRVGLARALVSDPSAILMDEPLGALDPITRKSIRKEFKELEELRKKAAVLVTHDITEAFELGDKICLMDKGKIVDRGSPKELLFESGNEFTADFLKGQRFQLTLQVLKVRDVLNSIKLKEGEADVQIKPDQLLSTVFEEYGHRSERLGVEGYPGKYITTEKLLGGIRGVE